MANDVTFQSATPATAPSGTIVETYDTGSGHRQLVALGASGTTAFTDPTCDTTADLILAANTLRKAAIIQNAGAVDVYLGPSGVTTSSGLLLAAGASLVDSASTSAWYGITSSGTADLRVCEVT